MTDLIAISNGAEKGVWQFSTESLRINQRGLLAGNAVLALLETAVTVEGVAHDMLANDSSHTLLQRLQTVAGIWHVGDMQEHYSEYIDDRVTHVDPETGLQTIGHLPKVRTCYMKQHTYDPKQTGAHAGRTTLGRHLTSSGLDELPQLLHDNEEHLELSIVGKRPRKPADFSLIPEARRQRDAQVYNALPLGLIDAYAADRKRGGTENNMRARSAYDEAYLHATTSGIHSRPEVDTVVVRAAIHELVPGTSKRLQRLVQRVLPHFVDGMVPMSQYDVQVGYDDLIRRPAQAILEAM